MDTRASLRLILLAKIQEMESEKRRILAELDKSIRRLRMDYNETAPVSSLPEELLLKIFTDSMELSPPKSAELLPPAMEVIVSHVSRRWREIALSSSLLWTNIRYRAQRECTGIEQEIERLSKVEAFLSRSKTSPLDIWVGFEADTWELYGSPVLSMIVKHVSRWRRFLVNCYGEPMVALHEALRTLSAPLLESMSIHPYPDQSYLLDLQEYDLLTDLTPCIFNAGAPRLSYLRLDGVSLLSFLPPTTNVQSLIMGNLAPSPYLELSKFWMMLSLPLTTLKLYGELFEDFSDSRVDKVLMQSLRNLSFSGSDATFYRLASIISAPKLDNLVLEDITNESAYTLERSFISLAHTPFPSLQGLTLSNCSIHEEFMGAFTSICSSVSHVTYNFRNDVQAISVDPLSVRKNEDDTIIWPKLAYITVNWMILPLPESLQHMLAVRRTLGVPVQKLWIKILPMVLENLTLAEKNEHQAKIQELVAEVEVKQLEAVKFSSEAWPPGCINAWEDYLFASKFFTWD